MLVFYESLTIILKYNHHSIIYVLNIFIKCENLIEFDGNHVFKRRK